MPEPRPSFRWEWTLANGVRIAAELDSSRNREVVFVGSRVVSDVERATRPAGHAVVAPGDPPDEAIAAVVTFQPKAPICILRVDGFEVAPSKWPVPAKRSAAVQARPSLRWLIAAAVGVGVAIAIAGAVAFRASFFDGPNKEEMSTSLRADNGLFIAHYPPALRTRPAVLPAPLGGVLLEDEKARESIVLAAFTLDATIAPDGWVLQQRFRDEVLASFPKTARTYVEAERREERCLNEPGAVIVGRFDRPDGAHARVWSCAFVKEGRGYFVAYALPEPSSDARLRRIVDGTELTQLASLGAPR